MTHSEPNPKPAAGNDMAAVPGFWPIFGVLAAVLFLGLIVQLSRVADFQKFGFYDEGAWLHLDELVANGAVPGKDAGYSYGMIPLIVGHWWFAACGRTPWAFMAFVWLCNLWGTWGVARIVHATLRVSGPYDFKTPKQQWAVIALAALFLSYGIIPNNYSLMHPLEMALIISALAAQARGRYGTALVWATIAVFTKPTMAYVLGLLLLLLAAWLKKGWKIVVPPIVAGILVVGLELATVGSGPFISNLLPLTGGKSYQLMGFGIFRAGMSFWWPQDWNLGSLLNHYLFGPALFWIAGSLFLWCSGTLALIRLAGQKSPVPAGPDTGKARDRDALLATLAILHATFVFLLYAWAGSWTYYSYLVILGMVVGLPAMNHAKLRKGLMWVFAIVALLGLKETYGDGWGRWMGTIRPAEAGGLWVYPDFWRESEKAREIARTADGGRRALWMANGAVGELWPEVRVPPSWFLSPGIPTTSEIAKIHAMITASDVVVLCKFYDQKQEAWNWDEFRDQREQFITAWEGDQFKVLRRK